MANRRMFSREIFQSSVMVKLGCDNPGFGLEAQRIWATLILTADDYGRGKYIPGAIRGAAFGTTPDSFAKVNTEMIEKWTQQIVDEGALILYTIDGDQYFQLTGWNRYQRGDWQRGKSLLPAPPQLDNSEGTVAEQTPDCQDKGKDKSKVKEKIKTPARKPRGHPAVSRWCELYEESFGQKFIVVPAHAKHITLASKALKDDLDEFTKRVGNCFADPWFREKMPGPSYFYQHINKYATTSKVDKSIIV